MRIVFAGTPEFAAVALDALALAAPARGWQIVQVLTQPDRPAGRGMQPAASAVRQVAYRHGLAVATPTTLSLARGGATAAAAHAALHALAPDVLIVAAYGLILPQAVLDLPHGLPDAGAGRLTAINLHASLLPRWRGAAPVARALEAGDTTTGMTLMQMEAGLDTGPMLRAEPLAIAADDTTATLTARLAALGAALLVPALADAQAGRLRAQAQPAAGVTYAHKLAKAEAPLDWTRPAALLARRVRAFDPFPVAHFSLAGQVVRVWRALTGPAPGSAALPGTVLAADRDGVCVACAEGVLRLTELQRAGGRRLPAREFLAGNPIAVGTVLDPAPPPPGG